VANVLIAGASGVVGTALWHGLRDGHTLHGLDRRPARGSGVRRGDVRRRRSIARRVAGMDVVIDLAMGASVSLPWSDIQKDVAARVNVLEAVRVHGVPRYILASSSHVTGGYEGEHPYAAILAGDYDGLDPRTIPLIGPEAEIRPDTPYGVGKAAAESTARYYSDQFGISCICIRIGTVIREDRPSRPRHFATFLTHADLVRLVDAAIRAPLDLRFGTYYGVSANTWRFWDIANARDDLGFEPQDDVEVFR
jgi:nucleoside-diphosphate-sugar epimerase